MHTIHTVEPSDAVEMKTSSNGTRISNGTMKGLYDGILTYEDTVLIVNDNSAISREIADHFVERRDIPQINIINITVPTDEIIDFNEFDDMFNQIKTTLSSRGLTDKIEYMVTTKGVPLKITSGYYNMNDQRYYSSASVDSELMLMDSSYESDIHRRWWIDNPYFQENVDPEDMQPFSRDTYGIRLVTRLTGYTVEEAKRLVDLAEPSLGVRGEAYLDMDPRKGIGNSGYGVGNLWMSDANTWLVENGHVSHLDNNNTFTTEHNNVSAYFSWGSNDGSWGASQMDNTGFETGSGPAVSSWTIESTGGTVERTTESVDAGSWSLKMTRTGTGVLRAYQDMTIDFFDHRYIADGRMRNIDVTSPGVRILLEGYDSGNSLLFTHHLVNRTGTRNWASYQDPIENNSDAVKIRYIVELLGDGTVYFDQCFMRVIRPHNQWVPGSIAETIVSTGGRSQTYGTWYGQSLVADIIRDGVTGLKGYAWEPFIGAISHADILFPAYYSGFSLAEAFWMGSELGSWMGYVVGDPKCTPYLNERADMGFSNEMEPMAPFVDEEGVPHLSIRLFNKGRTDVSGGLVELRINNVTIWDEKVFIGAGQHLFINISSEDEPQIIGEIEFEVLLNEDGHIWEYDGKNNRFIQTIRVNTVPEISLNLDSSELTRTKHLNFSLYIVDPDEDFLMENIEVEVRGPSGMVYLPDDIGNSIDGGALYLDHQFQPPWNASLGFYSIWARYTDPQGSFAEELEFSSFKVKNHLPELFGNISVEQIARGGRFHVNMTWEDPDSPEGDLYVSAFLSRAVGGRIEPISSNRTHPNSISFLFEIPTLDTSGTWNIDAEITDRDGGSDTWASTIRSFNREPKMIILEDHSKRITRMETASFTLKYMDPEGISANVIDLAVVGPISSPSPETILTREFSLSDNETREFSIPGTSLAIGDYQLIASYEDDERAGGTLTVSPLFEVIPLSPVILEPVLTYETGDGPPGGEFIKGDSIPVSIPITDPDGLGGSLSIEMDLISPDGSERDLFPERRGDGTYRTKINTDGTWDVGTYSIRLYIEDMDGMNASIYIEEFFTLDAEYPIFDEGEVFVDLNMTASVEVSITSFLSTSKPSELTIYLFDGSDTLVGEGTLLETGGFGLFQGQVQVSGRPVRGSILVLDDLDREFWMNETLSIEVQEPLTQDPGDGNGTGEGDEFLLYIILAGVALVIIMLAIITAVLISRSRKQKLVAPPPTLPELHGASGHPQLPVAPSPALPATGENSEGVVGQHSLPPGKVLEDVGSYHPPQEKQKEPPDIQESEEHKAVDKTQEPPADPDVTHAPTPVNEDIPKAQEPVSPEEKIPGPKTPEEQENL